MPAPWFSATVDGLTPVLGVSYVSSAPVTSQRGVDDSEIVNAGVDGEVCPVRDSGSAGFSFRLESPTVSAPELRLVGASSANRLRMTKLTPGSSGTTYQFQYWTGSAWVAIGSSFSLASSLVWYHLRVEWSGYGTSSGSVSYRIFLDGGEAVIASGSITGLNFTGLTGIVQAAWRALRGGQPSRVSNVFLVDNGGDSSYVYNTVANANGADADGTGDFNSINGPTGTTYDSTFISLPASGNRRSVKNTTNRNYNSRTVRAVSVNCRLRRGATGPTQVRVYLTIGGTRYYHPTTLTLGTAFQSYCMVWETDPSTSAPWTLTNAQAASLEWGWEVV